MEKPLTRAINYPPGRVTDLKVVAVQFNKMSVTIEWTAPGEQLDQGTGKIFSFLLDCPKIFN